MNSYLQCSVCLERPFNSTLKCGHCFCDQCIRQMTVNRSVSCPVCRGPSQRRGLRLRTDFPNQLLDVSSMKDIPGPSHATDEATPLHHNTTQEADATSVGAGVASESGLTNEASESGEAGRVNTARSFGDITSSAETGSNDGAASVPEEATGDGGTSSTIIVIS